MGLPVMPYTTHLKPASKELVPLRTQRSYIKPRQQCKLKKRTTRTTARAILRNEAQKLNWGRISSELMDVYMKDDVTIYVTWAKYDVYQKALSASRHTSDFGVSNRDHTNMCVIAARNWMRGKLIAP